MVSSQTRDWTRVPCIGRRILNHCAINDREVSVIYALKQKSPKWSACTPGCIQDNPLGHKNNLSEQDFFFYLWLLSLNISILCERFVTYTPYFTHMHTHPDVWPGEGHLLWIFCLAWERDIERRGRSSWTMVWSYTPGEIYWSTCRCLLFLGEKPTPPFSGKQRTFSQFSKSHTCEQACLCLKHQEWGQKLPPFS